MADKKTTKTVPGIRGPRTYGGADGHTHTAKQDTIAVQTMCAVAVTGPGTATVDCPNCPPVTG